MSSFTINFQANTTGDHYVGWRTYDMAPNTYNVETVAVAAPGAQSVEIDVAGSLYCAHSDIHYTGYLIAACMDQADVSPVNGIPDLALTWTVDVVEQTDPCIKTDITCESVAIASITIDDDGTGSCAPDAVYPLTITEATAGDEIVAADIDVTVTGGVVVSYVINNPGQYKAAPNLTHAIPLCSTNPAFTAVLDLTCPNLDISDIKCADRNDVSETPNYVLNHTETVTVCADVTQIPFLLSNFATVQQGNCHCEPCQKVDIDATGSGSGSGKVTYATCWDGSNGLGSITIVTQEVPFGVVMDLGCIIPSTLVLDQGNLDVDFTTNAVACT